MKPDTVTVSKDCIALRIPHPDPDEARNEVETVALMNPTEAARVAEEILGWLIQNGFGAKAEDVTFRMTCEIMEASGEIEELAEELS